MKKKMMAVILSALMIFILCSCGDGPSTTSVQVDGNVEMSEDADETLWSMLLKEPATSYSDELALVAAQMSAASEDTTGEGIKELYASYDIGFKAVGCYESGGELLKEQKTNGGAFAIGHLACSINGTDTTILIITARGTKNISESLGDFFKGWPLDPNKVHPFLDRTVWDNVYDFEEQIWDGLNEYVNKLYPDVKSTQHLKILVTGHSLGGAAANMVGARLTAGIGSSEWWGDKAVQDDIYVYTFGAIEVLTTEKNASAGYENIHNIYNHYDSFGPYGNLGVLGVSAVNAKFGHTDEYENYRSENGNSTNNHNMNDGYVEDVKNKLVSNAPCKLWTGTNSCLHSTESVDSELQDSPTGDFSIQGTWKNVGTSTFGQAQLGSIIVFDGIHCNYYSPCDTYVFYYEDGQWTLDCVSYIFAETLRFRIDIIDEDTIDVFYGTDAVRLARISRDAETIEEPDESEETESDFAIEGTWLSVGADGFGQAQPGVTVIFDGTHCNFYSPYDTYAFYQSDGQWRLDCTSFLFSETLNFRVEIIDADYINVYYGSTCTELSRIE